MEFQERPEIYKRKRDGLLVKAADWQDGDVSWVLVSPPVIGRKICGTCSSEAFYTGHEVVGEEAPSQPMTA